MILYLTKAGAIFHECRKRKTIRYTSIYAKVDDRYVCSGYYQCKFSINKDIFESLLLASKVRYVSPNEVVTSDDWYSATKKEFEFIELDAETIRI